MSRRFSPVQNAILARLTKVIRQNSPGMKQADRLAVEIVKILDQAEYDLQDRRDTALYSTKEPRE